LTQGNLFVGSQMTVTIDANLTLASGLLTKTGSGTLLLEETVNGNIEVLQGTLGGNFTEFGSLVNLATLSPGNSPGTITVYGNFQQARGGTLNIELASSTLYDRLIVAGRAQLGGTLDISLLNGFTPKQGEKFDFLSAGGIAGTFSKIDAPVWNDLTLRPFYGKNSVTIRAVVDSFANLSGLTPNEHAVGQTLDSMISDPRAANLINYLYGRSLADLPKDLERLSPDQLTSMGAFSIAYAQVQSLNLQRRTDDIRSGANGFSAANFAMNGFNPNYSGSMSFGSAGPNGNELSLDDGKDMKATKEVAPAESRWGAFVSGTGEWVNVEGTDNAHGYDIASGGFTLGVDYKLTPNLAIGLGAGYTGATADLTDHGRVWINGGKLGIYGTFFQNTPGAAPAPTMSKDSSKDSSKEAPAPAPSAGGGFYADFAAFGGFNGYSTRRDALEGEARGDTSGGEVDALFGAGYDIKKGNLTFGPTASFNYTYAGTRAFTEHDSLAPLDVHGLDTDSLRTAFGGKLSYECKCGSLLIKPELRLAWQHEFGDTAYTLDSSFASGAGGNFTTTGPRLGRDSLLVGAGFAIQINDRCSTYLYYDGELARRNYELNAVTGGFRIAF
jgi:outer membrane autotransporter protein